LNDKEIERKNQAIACKSEQIVIFVKKIFMQRVGFLKNIYLFYSEGFKNMTVGKTLWIIVLIKLFIMFGILKVFFFPDYLNEHFRDDAGKANHVRMELINKSK